MRDDLGLVRGFEREIRPLPIAEHAKAFELAGRWMSIYLRANSSARRRTSAGARPRDSLTTLNSIGSPWQSHPGTYGARKPSIERDFTMMSLRILFSAVPMWTSPFANGGPSWRTNIGAPFRASSTCR
jgi:hypothetical protein